MAKSPLTVYRVWCGRKRYSGWLANKNDAFRLAVSYGLAYEDLDGKGGVGLGPLTWIETGTRRYARSRTIPDALS